MSNKSNYLDQEKFFKTLLKIKGNETCADCNYPSPSWSSLDFGTLICYQCSAFHRQLGPTISKVRSINLDKWTPEQMEVIFNVGNKIANNYWEKTLDTVQKINFQSSETDKKAFIYNKYVKKAFCLDKNGVNPVKSFLENKSNKQNIKNIERINDNSNNNALTTKKSLFNKKRATTPQPCKEFTFEWNNGKNIIDNNNNKDGNKWRWRNFENFKNFEKDIKVNSETKTPTNSKAINVNEFKAVSFEFRAKLLQGNPLAILKDCTENNFK